MASISVNNEFFRNLLRYEFYAGTTATQAVQNICENYGEGAISRSTAFRWYAMFRKGELGVKDAIRSGRPVEFDQKHLQVLLDQNDHQRNELADHTEFIHSIAKDDIFKMEEDEARNADNSSEPSQKKYRLSMPISSTASAKRVDTVQCVPHSLSFQGRRLPSKVVRIPVNPNSLPGSRQGVGTAPPFSRAQVKIIATPSLSSALPISTTRNVQAKLELTELPSTSRQAQTNTEALSKQHPGRLRHAFVECSTGNEHGSSNKQENLFQETEKEENSKSSRFAPDSTTQNSDFSMPATFKSKCQSIRRWIAAGNIDEAITFIDLYFPNLLKQRHGLRLALEHQRFVEKIVEIMPTINESRDGAGALKLIQLMLGIRQELDLLDPTSSLMLTKLQDALKLMQKVNDSNCAYLLGQAPRDLLAESIVTGISIHANIDLM